MGKVIEFYHPQPRPAPVAADIPEVPEPAISPTDMLREILGNSENLRDVVVLMRDKDGTCGLVGNMEGIGESIVFMEQIKYELIRRLSSQPQGGPKGTIA